MTPFSGRDRITGVCRRVPEFAETLPPRSRYIGLFVPRHTQLTSASPSRAASGPRRNRDLNLGQVRNARR
jgi:hypothetical protein